MAVQQVRKTLNGELEKLFQEWGLSNAEAKASLLAQWLERGEYFYITGRGEEGERRLRALQEVLGRHNHPTVVAKVKDTYYLLPFPKEFLSVEEVPGKKGQRAEGTEKKAEGEEEKLEEEVKPPIQEILQKIKGKVVREWVRPVDSLFWGVEKLFPLNLEPPYLRKAYAVVAKRGSIPTEDEERKLAVATNPSIGGQFSAYLQRLSRQLEEDWKGVARGRGNKGAVEHLAKVDRDKGLLEEEKYALYNIDLYGWYTTSSLEGRRNTFYRIVEEYLFFRHEENFNSYFSKFPPTWRGMVEWTARRLAELHAAKLRGNSIEVDEDKLFRAYRAAIAAQMVVESAGSRGAFADHFTREWIEGRGGSDSVSLSDLREWYGLYPTIFTVEMVKEGGSIRVERRAYILREGRIEVYREKDGRLVHVGDVKEVKTVLSDGSPFTLKVEERDGKSFFMATPSPFIHIGGVNVRGEAGREEIYQVTHLNKVSYKWENIQYNQRWMKGRWVSTEKGLFTDISDIGLFQLTLEYALSPGELFPVWGFASSMQVERVEEDIALWGQRRAQWRGEPFKPANVYVVPGPANVVDGKGAYERIASSAGIIVGRGQRYLHVVGDKQRVKEDEEGLYIEGAGGEKLYLSPGATHLFALERVGGEGSKNILYNAYILVDGEGRLLDSTLLENFEDLASLDGREVEVEVAGEKVKAVVRHVGTLRIDVDMHRDYARGNDGMALLLSENFTEEGLFNHYLSQPLPKAYDEAEGLPYIPLQPIGRATLYNPEGWDYQAWVAVEYTTSHGPVWKYGEAEWVVVERRAEEPSEEPTPQPQPTPTPEKPSVERRRPEVPRQQYVLEGSFLTAKADLPLPSDYIEELRGIAPPHLFYVTERVGEREYVLDKKGRRVGLMVKGNVVLLTSSSTGTVESVVGREDLVERAVEGDESAINTLKNAGLEVDSIPFTAMQKMHFAKDSLIWQVLYGDESIILSEDGTAKLITPIHAKLGREYVFNVLSYSGGEVREKDGKVTGFSLSYLPSQQVVVRAREPERAPPVNLPSSTEGDRVMGVMEDVRFSSNVNVGVDYAKLGSLAEAKLAWEKGDKEKALMELEEAFEVAYYSCCGVNITVSDLAKAYYKKCPQGGCSLADDGFIRELAWEVVGKELSDEEVGMFRNAIATLLVQGDWHPEAPTNAMEDFLHTLGRVLSTDPESLQEDPVSEVVNVYSQYRSSLTGIGAIIQSTGTLRILLPTHIAKVVLPKFVFYVKEENGEDRRMSLSIGAVFQFIEAAYEDGLITYIVEEGREGWVFTEKGLRVLGGSGSIQTSFEYEAGSVGGWVELDIGLGYVTVVGGDEEEGGGLNFKALTSGKFVPVGKVKGGVEYIFGDPNKGWALSLSLEGEVNWGELNLGTLELRRVKKDGEERIEVVSAPSDITILIDPSIGLMLSSNVTVRVGAEYRRSRAGTMVGPFVDLYWVNKDGDVIRVTGKQTTGDGKTNRVVALTGKMKCGPNKNCSWVIKVGQYSGIESLLEPTEEYTVYGLYLGGSFTRMW